jgi:hypothetical protein
MRARVCASSVLPEPVGPISRMLLFASSTPSLPLSWWRDALVVVVDRDGEDLLRRILADHVLVEDVADFLRRRQLALGGAGRLGGDLIANDVVAQLDALVADEDRRDRRSAS